MKRAFRLPIHSPYLVSAAVRHPLQAAPSQSHDSDELLVHECLAGSEMAWATLLDKYKRLIYSIPVKYGLSPDERNDIYQDVCLELLRTLPRLRHPRALPKWLIQTTSHKCLNYERRRAQRPVDGAGAPIEPAIDVEHLPDHVVLDAEREQALRDAIADLPPRCQTLIRLLFFESPPRPYEDVARMLNLACGSIGFIRGRCLERLRKQLHRNGLR